MSVYMMIEIMSELLLLLLVVVICDKRGSGVASLDGWTIASNSTGSTLSRISLLTEFGDGHPVGEDFDKVE